MISFIVPAYNAEKTIDKCLNSIFELDKCSLDYEVIVINDASKDSTHEHIIKYSEKDNFIYINSDKTLLIPVPSNYNRDNVLKLIKFFNLEYDIREIED